MLPNSIISNTCKYDIECLHVYAAQLGGSLFSGRRGILELEGILGFPRVYLFIRSSRNF